MSPNSDLSDFAARLRRFIDIAPDAEDQFNQLALELFGLQFRHNAPYRRLCEKRHISPETVTHWSGIPAAPTVAFKELELSCLPTGERTAVFHSSGTTEQRPSRNFHNSDSLAVYEASLWKWFAAHFPASAEIDLMVLTPPSAEVPHSSLVHMFNVIRHKMNCPESVFTARAVAEGGWTLDLERTIKRLQEAAESGKPVGILGTAFSFVQLLDASTERGLRLSLPAGSWALETGGYKGRSRTLPKQELHTLITKQLDVPSTRIICEYGMSELSSQAYDLAIGSASNETKALARRLRFPPWTRAQIISPETGKEASGGETGLIRVYDLANVYSVMAVQTEDLAIRRDDGFELVGRAPAAEVRGCSLMAIDPA